LSRAYGAGPVVPEVSDGAEDVVSDGEEDEVSDDAEDEVVWDFDLRTGE
jgi:hypothetical protein